MSERRNQGDRGGTDSAAHDVLAAEAFAMPVADPSIHPRPVVLPDDPTGIGEPHDVLAAEEFAMPAVPAHHAVATTGGGLGSRGRLVVIGLLLLVLLRRRRNR